MPTIKYVNATTGEEIEREMNDKEIADATKLAEKWEAEVAAEEAKVNAKSELLQKLGITKEEAKLLLS